MFAYVKGFPTIQASIKQQNEKLPNIIEQGFVRDTTKLYRKMERTVLRISDYKNH